MVQNDLKHLNRPQCPLPGISPLLSQVLGFWVHEVMVGSQRKGLGCLQDAIVGRCFKEETQRRTQDTLKRLCLCPSKELAYLVYVGPEVSGCEFGQSSLIPTLCMSCHLATVAMLNRGNGNRNQQNIYLFNIINEQIHLSGNSLKTKGPTLKAVFDDY